MPEHAEPGIYVSTVMSPEVLKSPDADDRVPSSVTYGSVFDLAAVEIDPRVDTIIEIGGQDSKFLSVEWDEASGQMVLADFAMNAPYIG